MTRAMGIRRAVLFAVAVAGLAAVAFPRAAYAQPTEAQKKEAREHNDLATRFYEVGKYGEAIEEYQKVYLIVDDPVLLFNIAQSYRLWGKPDEAVRFYRNYLRRAPNAPNRADVEKKIADQEKLIDERKRASTTTAPPPVTTAPPVEATAPPPPPPPPTTTTTVTPSPTATEPPVTTVVQPSAPGAEDHHGRRVAAYSFLVGGGALVVTSVVAGAVASKKAKDLERMSQDPSHPVFNPDIESSGKSANRIAIVTGVLGVAAAVTGGILLLTAGSSSGPQVSLYPVLGPQAAGGGARVTF